MMIRTFSLFIMAGAIFLNACGAPTPKYRVKVENTPQTRELKGTQKPYSVNGTRYEPLRNSAGFVQSGIASWYGKDFHGRKTSNGEIYDMYALTAAHKTLPMNVHVKVTNQNTGRSMVVRVNDRGPFIQGRIIDLSYSAAKELGVVGPGTAPVRIEALGYKEKSSAGKGAHYRQPTSYQVGSFTIQVGAFTMADNANRLAAKLRSQYGHASVTQGEVNGRMFYRVRAGKYRTIEAAENARNSFEEDGFQHSFVIAME